MQVCAHGSAAGNVSILNKQFDHIGLKTWDDLHQAMQRLGAEKICTVVHVINSRCCVFQLPHSDPDDIVIFLVVCLSASQPNFTSSRHKDFHIITTAVAVICSGCSKCLFASTVYIVYVLTGNRQLSLSQMNTNNTIIYLL